MAKTTGMDEEFDENRPLAGSEVSELIAIARKNLQSHPLGVIEDCNLMLKYMGNKPHIYELLGEAQIILKEYIKAENSILTAIALGRNTKSNYLMLASLIKFRGNQTLSKRYFTIGVKGSFAEEVRVSP